MIEPANQYGRITDINDLTKIDDAYSIMEKLIERDPIKIGNSLFNLPSKNELILFMKDVIRNG